MWRVHVPVECIRMKVMLLAAGDGHRMRPLTDNIPKPLLKAGNSTLIEQWIDTFTDSGCSEFVINTRYQGDMLVNTLGNGQDRGISIAYSQESCRIGTGGGIRKALPLLGDEDFVVVSTDTACDYDVTCLPVSLPEGVLGHLLMVDNPEHHRGGDFALNSDGKLIAAGDCLTYAGIGVFSPALFAEAPEGAFELRLLMDAAIACGRLTGEYHDGFWLDVGTVDRYEALKSYYAGAL